MFLLNKGVAKILHNKNMISHFHCVFCQWNHVSMKMTFLKNKNKNLKHMWIGPIVAPLTILLYWFWGRLAWNIMLFFLFFTNRNRRWCQRFYNTYAFYSINWVKPLWYNKTLFISINKMGGIKLYNNQEKL